MVHDAKPLKGVYLYTQYNLESLYGEALAAGCGANIQILNPADVKDPNEISFAVCWGPAADAFAPYPNLQLAIAASAGVDYLVKHPGLPPHVQITRIRDPHQAAQMAGFAVHEILEVERRFPLITQNAAKSIWEDLDSRAPVDVKVAVLGGGGMGSAVAEAAKALGFTVRVASRSEPKQPVEGITYFSGDEAVLRAAENADFCVNVLPLTPQTRNILNRKLFDRMARGSWLVQIGRGEHLHEADLLAAIEDGQLAGATLDVFRDEPLGPDHPMWKHPQLRITPHIASCATPRIVSEQIAQTLKEFRDGRELTFAVDRAKGY